MVASCRFTSFHQGSVFAVVTDDCHANVVLVSHVTINYERCHAAFSIRVDDVRSTWSVGIAQLNLATAFIFCKDGILKVLVKFGVHRLPHKFHLRTFAKIF